MAKGSNVIPLGRKTNLYRVQVQVERYRGADGDEPYSAELVKAADEAARRLADLPNVFQSELCLGMKVVAHYVPTQIRALVETLRGRGYHGLAQAIERESDLGEELIKVLELSPNQESCK